jgi:hypothetical protein
MEENHGKAGISTHRMAEDRYQRATVYAIVLLIIGIAMLASITISGRLGLLGIIIPIVILSIANRLEKKGLFLKKRAKDAERGAYGEEKVERELKTLPESYNTFHDLVFNGFNIDHVVIGPGGIFLIETKSHRGRVDAQGDTLLLNGSPPQKDFLKQTWAQTFQLKDFLKKHTSKEWYVKPVLCFTQAYVNIRQPIKGIDVVNVGYLAKYLARQRHPLKTEEKEGLVRILQSCLSEQR